MNLDYGGLDPNYVDQIRTFEGFNPRAYGDYKQTSIGYGTKALYPGEVIDKAEGERRLNAELGRAAGYVDSMGVGNIPEGARAALTSLTYNAGPGWMNSGLGAAVRAGDWDAAKQHFGQYVNAGGSPNSALAKRRQSELSWFDGNNAPMATAFADNRNANMNPLQAAFASNGPAQSYDPSYDPNAGLFDRVRAGGPGALFGAPHGVFPGANGRPGYNLGTALQKAALFAMNKPEALGAVGNDRKFVQIGTDDWGNPRYGFVDPQRGTVMPVQGGAGGNTSGAGGAGGGQGLGDGVTEALKTGLTGEDLLKQPGVAPGVAQIVRGLSAGTQPYNPGTLMRTPQGRMALALLDQYEPGATPADFMGRAAGMRDWATKSAEITRRAQQAALHGSELVDSFGDMHNTAYPAVNAVKNFVSEQTGGGAPTAARLNVTAFANEMGAFIRGNGGSDASTHEWEQSFPVNGSPEQQRAALGKGAQLFEDQIKALEDKRLKAVGSAQVAKMGPIVTPDVQAALAKMKSYAAGGTSKSAPTISNIRQIQ